MSTLNHPYAVSIVLAFGGSFLLLGGLFHLGGTLGYLVAGEGVLCCAGALFWFGYSLQPGDDLLWLLGWPLSIVLDGLWLALAPTVFLCIAAGLACFFLGVIASVGIRDPRTKELHFTLLTLVALPIYPWLERLAGVWLESMWPYLILVILLGVVVEHIAKRRKRP